MDLPQLRDQHGQIWPWPPLESPDGGPRPSRAWLAFLPGAFTPVCTRELGWMPRLAASLAEHDTVLRVISCDPAPVLRAVADELGLEIPLLSDFWPHGAAARSFGAFDENTGKALRSSVLIDAHGIELARIRAEAGQERTPEEHLRLL